LSFFPSLMPVKNQCRQPFQATDPAENQMPCSLFSANESNIPRRRTFCQLFSCIFFNFFRA
ncbi:hypothetical protein, partial [Treponema endosymbiont of Eucomonympha sp.]|uniref:hypothetical protein n=1 Tax=Treponema endosymbiont of Eucomonympha sp. TaxID=1580831 RepID=UPI001EE72B1A